MEESKTKKLENELKSAGDYFGSYCIILTDRDGLSICSYYKNDLSIDESALSAIQPLMQDTQQKLEEYILSLLPNRSIPVPGFNRENIDMVPDGAEDLIVTYKMPELSQKAIGTSRIETKKYRLILRVDNGQSCSLVQAHLINLSDSTGSAKKRETMIRDSKKYLEKLEQMLNS